MTSIPSVTLFGGQIQSGHSSASLAASAVVHAAVAALVSFGILNAPQIDTHTQARLVVRDLELHKPDEQPQRAISGISYPGAQPAAARRAPRAHPVLRLAVHARHGAQTLLQPDLARRLALSEQVPVPRVLIWMPSKVVVKHVVAPAVQPPPAAAVHPSFQRPNREIHVGDVDLAASNLPSMKLQLLPSSTSPVVQQNLAAAQLPAASVSQAEATPTPSAILSLSDLTMKNGTAVLPPVNESATLSTPGSLGSGAPAGSGKNGVGSGGSGSGAGAQSVAAPQGVVHGGTSGPQQGSATGVPQGDPTETQITLPKTGQFGAVVVGDSLEDEYPETSGVWSGRTAYTVYLHVGLARSWILQYALPAEADAGGGQVPRIDAPWPYSIVRPNLAPGSVEADAILVHGYVGRNGRFRDLSVVFPQPFPQAQFVLKSLDQWQFRPAAENGQSARVEVLLIIPEELD